LSIVYRASYPITALPHPFVLPHCGNHPKSPPTTMARQFLSMPHCNDLVLLATLSYSAVDIQSEWATFSTCRQPVHQWLLASYALLLSFRLVHSVGSQSSASATEGEFLINLRLKETMPQLMLYATWFVVMPAFLVWTVAGTFWTWDVWNHSPECLPAQFLWFTVLWQVVSYFWIATHLVIGFVALSRERRLRSIESDLRALEDPETVERWGVVSQLQSESAMSGSIALRGRHGHSTRPGLSPAQIGALGGIGQVEDPSDPFTDPEECSVCLADLHPGETLRHLPNCTHCFHRSCIDLWLLQSASCPLCKVEVSVSRPPPTTRKAESFWV